MKRIVFYTLIALMFTACEDVIEVDLNDEDTDLYAVEAKITTQDEPYVFLTKGLPVSVDQEFQGISDAIINISDDAIPSRNVILTEDKYKKGFYQVPADVDYYGVIGREYTITIEIEENELTASDVLNQVSPIDSIDIWPSLRGERRFLGVFMYGQEPAGKGNYYKWDIYINNTLLKDAGLLALANDDLVDGSYVNALEIFTDYHNPANPEERLLQHDDSVYVKQVSLSEFAYNYYSQMLGQSMRGSMFSVPPANIKGNFTCSNGKEVLGLFTAHDVSTSNTVNIDDNIEFQMVN